MQSRLTRPRIPRRTYSCQRQNRSACGTNLARDPPAIERDPWRAVSPAEFGVEWIIEFGHPFQVALEGARR